MQAFGFLSKAFKELATWIQSLAEFESDKIDQTIIGANSDVPRRGSDGLSSMSMGTSAGSTLSSSGFGGGIGGGAYSRRNGSMGGGIYMNAPRNRGLAELVGRPDFFLDLHARFVALAAQLASA